MRWVNEVSSGTSVISGELSEIGGLFGEIGMPERITPDKYDGSYLFIPTEEVQEIEIEDKMATRNIIIDAIPENYGRLIWEGNRLTVY